MRKLVSGCVMSRLTERSRSTPVGLDDDLVVDEEHRELGVPRVAGVPRFFRHAGHHLLDLLVHFVSPASMHEKTIKQEPIPL